jgi:hypothetical protein
MNTCNIYDKNASIPRAFSMRGDRMKTFLLCNQPNAASDMTPKLQTGNVTMCCLLRAKFFLIGIVGGGIQAGSTRHVGHWMAYCTCPGWLWWGRNWWNEDWQGTPKYSEKTSPAPLCPPQVPLDQTRARTRAAAVGSQRLTAWAMARPCSGLSYILGDGDRWVWFSGGMEVNRRKSKNSEKNVA